jgi:hypothetical protein
VVFLVFATINDIIDCTTTMSNPGADSLHASNPSVHPNPISEVGSSPFVTLDQLIAIMNQSRGQSVSEEPKEVPLPEFNPENAGADPAAWCLTASRFMERRPIQGDELFLTVSRALKGTASQWLTQIPVDADYTWARFKELFLARFCGKETATSALMKMLAEPQLEGESMGAYGMRLRSLLGARWDHLTAVEIVNATVLHHLSLRDERVEKIALTSDVKTRDQFITEMNAFHYAKKMLIPSSGTSSAGPEAKRRKPSDPRIKCHYCGVPGHKIAECHTRMKTEGPETTRRPEKSRPAVSSKVSCFKCREEGHIAPNCPLLRKTNRDSDNERRLNSRVVESPTGKLSHLGESFSFCFDSGAECSLIRESMASKFSGKRTTDVVVMRGIGNNRINCTSQVLSIVRINDFALEITFHILDDSYLECDIMIGREILSQGFDVGISQNSLTISRAKTVNSCNKTVENKIDINELDTEVLGEETD